MHESELSNGGEGGEVDQHAQWDEKLNWTRELCSDEHFSWTASNNFKKTEKIVYWVTHSYTYHLNQFIIVHYAQAFARLHSVPMHISLANIIRISTFSQAQHISTTIKLWPRKKK